MKKLQFFYSTMNAGKSMHLIMKFNNYIELGLKPLVVVPNGLKTKVKSRTGFEIEAINFNSLVDIDLKEEKYDCVLVDESQFLTRKQVEFLSILTYLDIEVICYGLKISSSGNVFEGSNFLFGLADEVNEIPSLCMCSDKATMHIRTFNGELELSDKVISKTDGNVEYISLCKKCYYDILSGEKDANFLAKLYGNSKK
ncbi:thymidine kinase [Clostridium perfringens]